MRLDKTSEITKNIKIIEWMKTELIMSVGDVFNLLFKGVKKAVLENGFLGIFMGGFTASAVGISAALIFGYLASLIFKPKMKN